MRKKSYHIIIFFFTLFIFISCNKNSTVNEKENALIKTEELKKSKGFGVVNVDRLRFRSDNDLHSKTLMYLDRGTIVSVIKKDNNRVKIGEMEDYWYQIEFEGITGWVFGYFIDVYSTRKNALFIAEQYLVKSEKNNNTDFSYDDSINNNLFFLTEGKLFQVIDGVEENNKVLKTEPGQEVVNYFFSNTPNHIYYIAKQPKDFYENGHLYRYNLNSGKNELLVRNVYSADINTKNNIILILTIQRTINTKYWLIRLINLDKPNDIKTISKIKQIRDNHVKENDTYTMTLARELGSLAFLKLNEEGNFIYFKPSEENLTYLVSILNGEYIKIEKEQENPFYIDSTQFLSIQSSQNSSGEIIYTLVLNDKFSGKQKEIVTSTLYPINFSASPRKNYLCISMINLNKMIGNYYFSNVYILSLSTYSLMPISPESVSYQPKWSNNHLQ